MTTTPAAADVLASPGRAAANRGLRHLTHERIGEAVEAFEEAVALLPDDADIHAFRAAALYAAADPEGAMHASARSLGLAPDGFWPNLKTAELSERLGDLAGAEERALLALRAVEPGTAESIAAAHALARIRTARAASIPHRAFLPRRPRWTRRRGAAASSVPVGEA